MNQANADLELFDSAEVTLEIVEPPYLPSSSTDSYTLILDLDETLVHYQEVIFKLMLVGG